MNKALEHGWSRDVMVIQMERDLYRREGKAITNFADKLPAPQSDLAHQSLKDPYIFDFLTTDQNAHERETEKGLAKHVQKFLLELGTGFAFVGTQFHLEVAGKDFYPDMVFYHY